MKRKIIILVVSLILTTLVIAGLSMASHGHQAPAPQSGDGIPDGSGYDSPSGPYGFDYPGKGHQGPAPHSGDGIPDGSGW
jgi:hypothetical protein